MSETAEPLEELLTKATEAAEAKRLDEAEAILQEVLAKDANNLRAFDLYGFVRFFQERFVEAEEYCRKSLAIKPSHPYALKGLGLCLAKQGKLEPGIVALERAIGNAPGWMDPYWDLAVILTDVGRYEQALGVLERGQMMVREGRSDLIAFAGKVRGQMSVARQQKP